jgi:hypothetical protein
MVAGRLHDDVEILLLREVRADFGRELRCTRWLRLHGVRELEIRAGVAVSCEHCDETVIVAVHGLILFLLDERDGGGVRGRDEVLHLLARDRYFNIKLHTIIYRTTL